MSSTKKIYLDQAFLPSFFIILVVFILPSLVFSWVVMNGMAFQETQNMPATIPTAIYPESGNDLDATHFAQQLPPPPRDALPYDVREPLVNGSSVPVKKRWIWVPDGQSITVEAGEDGSYRVDIPVGTKWWKEFYIQTDRGAYLIERRLIVRVQPTEEQPNGWMYYTAHHLPGNTVLTQPLVLPSSSSDADAFMYQASDWLPTQSMTQHVEVRFEDARGVQYDYVFPGQTQCVACHLGATGSYPNPVEEPIEVFGLHPQNLTPASFAALVARGWIVGGEAMFAASHSAATEAGVASEEPTLESTHRALVAVIRNNCASCHNGSPRAMGSFTSFVVDPNYDYSPTELLAVFSAQGRMVANAYPLVTPGSLQESEIYLRLLGKDGRRRMPPLEGGLPEPDPRILRLFEQWIMLVGTQP